MYGDSLLSLQFFCKSRTVLKIKYTNIHSLKILPNCRAMSAFSHLSLFWSAEAAITKCHRQGGLRGRRLLPTTPEAGKPRATALAGSARGEGPLPACRELPCAVSSRGWILGASSPSYRGTNSIMRPRELTTPKAPPPNTIFLGVRASLFAHSTTDFSKII